MSTTNSQFVHQVYITYLQRPAEPGGHAFWVNELEQGVITREELAAEFGGSEEFTGRFTEANRAELINEVYQALFGRDAEAEGMAFWLNDDTDIALLPTAIAGGSADWDGATAQNRLIFAEKLLENMTPEQYASVSQAELREMLSNVTDTTEVTDEFVAGVVAGVVPEQPEEPGEPEVPSVTGETYTLTEGRDNITGTADNDTFIADVGQNQNGAISNALATGDRLDGGDGYDVLQATLINDNEVDGVNLLGQAPRPTTNNIEEVRIEALEDVRLDATRMEDVQQYWADFGRGDLEIDNITLRGDNNLNVTSDVTFGIKDTEHDTDFTALFDSQSLLNAPSESVNSQLLVRVADLGSGTAASPLGNVTFSVSFDLGGEQTTLEDVVSADGSYQGMADAIEAALEEQGLGSLNVELANLYNQVTVGNNTVNLEFDAYEILITDPNGKVFDNVAFDYSSIDSANDDFHVIGTARPADPAIESNLITSNLILDNAGRGSMAGDVLIGGASNSNLGVEQINVVVDRSSKIESLSSTNNTLQVVNIDSIGAEGDLTIGSWGLIDVREVNATDFAGNLNLSAFLSSGVTAKYLNLNDQAEDAAADDNVDFLYALGAGNDVLNLQISSANLADAGTTNREDFVLNVDAGAGNDIITVGTNDYSAGNWYANSKLNANLSVDAGEGNDTVRINGSGDWVVDLGAGDDVLYANTDGQQALWVFNAVNPVAPNFEAAQQAVAEAEFAVQVALRAPAALATLQAAVDALEAEIGDAPVAADPDATPPVEAVVATGLNKAVEDAQEAADAATTALSIAEAARDNAQTAAELPDATADDITAYQTAQAAYLAAVDDDAAAADALIAAQGDLTAAQDALTAAQGALTAAEGPFDATELATAEAALETAEQNLESAVGNLLPSDLESGANTDFGSLFGSTLTVEFKGFESAVTLGLNANTVLEVNQAIKQAIQSDAVLSKLLAVHDGPANTLVVRSLIDGGQTDVGINVDIAAPAAAALTAADVVAYNAANGTSFTTGAQLAPVIAANVAKTDAYTTDAAEQLIVGVDSQATADNTINAGTGFDVIVLGTGENSNDTVVLEGAFGTNTIVNFTAGALADKAGRDVLDFSSYDVDGVVGFGASLGTVAGANTDYIQIVAYTGNAIDDAGAYTVNKVSINADGVSSTAHLGELVFGDADLAGVAVEENFIF